jgi:hypothetical protein
VRTKAASGFLNSGKILHTCIAAISSFITNLQGINNPGNTGIIQLCASEHLSAGQMASVVSLNTGSPRCGLMESSKAELKAAGSNLPSKTSARLSQRAYPLWQVVAASTAIGVIMAVYILALGRMSFDQLNTQVSPVKAAAALAAKRIVESAEMSARFGPIGLCDVTLPAEMSNGAENGPQRICSFNSVNAAIRCASIIADRVNREALNKQIVDDIGSLDEVKSRLLTKLTGLVQSPQGGGLGTINGGPSGGIVYEEVAKIMRRDNTREIVLTSISIQLGRFEGEMSKPALIPASNFDKGQEFVSDGFYKPDFPVPVLADKTVQFYRTASVSEMVDPRKFILAAPGVLPNAVLVEAKFEPKEKKPNSPTIVKQACATLAAPPPPSTRSSLVMRFPHGLPKQFRSINDLTAPSVWSKNGEWEQATDGSVPGDGHLQPSIDPVLPAMPPGDALLVGIYHWIKHIYPTPDPEKILSMMGTDLAGAESSRKLATQTVNSCLVRDTGATERGFIKGTGPGSEGQKALMTCFEFATEGEVYPNGAMPLFVDGNGQLNLAGRSSFDQELVKKYLDTVYDTNIAAFESIAISRNVKRRAEVELGSLEDKMMVQRQEISSLTERLKVLMKNTSQSKLDLSAEQKREIERTSTKLESLKTSNSVLKDRVAQLRRVDRLTETSMRNAERAAARTYELSSAAFSFLRNGLHELDKPDTGFLLGRKSVFVPIVDPVKETDFFDASQFEPTEEDKKSGEKSWQPDQISPWFSKTLTILTPWEKFQGNAQLSGTRQPTGDSGQSTGDSGQPAGTSGQSLSGGKYRVKVNNKLISEVVAEVEMTKPSDPLTVVFDSNDLYKDKQIQPHRMTDYPFAGLALPPGHAFYYSRAATNTGEKGDVEWSAVIRDAVFQRDRPLLRSLDPRWGNRATPAIDESPGLALEFQLRRPLPHLEDMPAGANITDPAYHRQVPQIPPMPGEMM